MWKSRTVKYLGTNHVKHTGGEGNVSNPGKTYSSVFGLRASAAYTEVTRERNFPRTCSVPPAETMDFTTVPPNTDAAFFFAFPNGVYRRCSFSPCLFADGLLGGNFPQREFITHQMKFYYRAYRSQDVKSPKTLKSGCRASRLFPAWMSQVSQGQSILGSRGVSPKKKTKQSLIS